MELFGKFLERISGRESRHLKEQVKSLEENNRLLRARLAEKHQARQGIGKCAQGVQELLKAASDKLLEDKGIGFEFEVKRGEKGFALASFRAIVTWKFIMNAMRELVREEELIFKGNINC